MKPIDLSKILAKHKKGWIALTPDNKKLVATGGSLSQVLRKAREKGVSNPSVLKSPKVERLFAG